MGLRRTKFIFTLDTEEDNWGNYAAREGALSNIRRLPQFHDECQALGIRPTYLLTYPVMSDPQARDHFAAWSAAGECELGTHCHPWNTPPFDETPCTTNSMLHQLPESLQSMKLESLTTRFRESFGFHPRSFRAGRWGFGPSVSLKLEALGYSVDTSVIPLQSWTSTPGSDYRAVPIKPFWKSINGVFPGKICAENLLEVPVTVGFLQSSAARTERLFRMASQPMFRRFHAVGILERLSLANRIALLPEVYSLERMIQLTERLIDAGVPYLNFSFHSCTLAEGLTPFTKTTKEAAEFRKKVLSYFEFIKTQGVESITLAEAANEISGVPGQGTGSSAGVSSPKGNALNRLKDSEPVAPLRNVSWG